MAFVGDFKAFPLWGAAFLIERDVFKESADHEPQERRQQRIPRDAAQEKTMPGEPKMPCYPSGRRAPTRRRTRTTRRSTGRRPPASAGLRGWPARVAQSCPKGLFMTFQWVRVKVWTGRQAARRKQFALASSLTIPAWRHGGGERVSCRRVVTILRRRRSRRGGGARDALGRDAEPFERRFESDAPGPHAGGVRPLDVHGE